jgi:hypothetical protein
LELAVSVLTQKPLLVAKADVGEIERSAEMTVRRISDSPSSSALASGM